MAKDSGSQITPQLASYLLILLKRQVPVVRAGAGKVAGRTDSDRRKLIAKLKSAAPLTLGELGRVSAIVRDVNERPAILLNNDSFDPEDPKLSFWATVLAPAQASLAAVARATAAIFVRAPGESSPVIAGTGFMVADDIMMTNRHVAVQFADGIGVDNPQQKSGHSAFADFGREFSKKQQPAVHHVLRPLLLHPHWDMALLEVEGLAKKIQPVLLDSSADFPEVRRKIALIGHPVISHGGTTAQMKALVGKASGFKHLSPGETMALNQISYDGFDSSTVFTHDCGSLGGNSGSPVIDLFTGKVIGLHAAGSSEFNACFLAGGFARDPQLALASRLNFDTTVKPVADPLVAESWAMAKAGRMPRTATQKKWKPVDSARQPALHRPMTRPSERARFQSDTGAMPLLDVNPDIRDLRDRFYEPSLRDLQVRLLPKAISSHDILDQGSEGACTGFALAAAIGILARHRANEQSLFIDRYAPRVSTRMLYEMARIHDEWPGEDYSGSSIRGAIKGFFHNGVCRAGPPETEGPGIPWSLDVRRAKEARNISLGAYYRLRPEIIDYHAALNEVGAIVCSAYVHEGWSTLFPGSRKSLARPEEIAFDKNWEPTGMHAFVIVGYDEEGFDVLNSWGPAWGDPTRPGIARWRYEDWARNVSDAWVLRLAIPSSYAFDAGHEQRALSMARTRKDTPGSGQKRSESFEFEPRRSDVLGHFLHIDDGKMVETGRYGTSLESIAATAKYLAGEGRKKYDHILLYAHGGLNSAGASARRIATTREAFKRNRIYPVHFMWETGVSEEFADILRGLALESIERAGSASEVFDWTIEKLSGAAGRKFWREMKRDAELAFQAGSVPLAAVREILKLGEKKPGFKLHMVGHSAGSILLGHLLQALMQDEADVTFESASLFAPACSLAFYRRHILPAIKGVLKQEPGTPRVQIKDLHQYNLSEQLELADRVGPYRKSLLHLVSNAYEDFRKLPLLGLSESLRGIALPPNHRLWTSGVDFTRTQSTSHGDFDNDPPTMTSLLKTILGEKTYNPVLDFRPEELLGF